MTASKACGLVTPAEGEYKNAEYHFDDCLRLAKFCKNHAGIKMRELRSYEEADAEDIPFCGQCLKDKKAGRKHVKAIPASGFSEYSLPRTCFALPSHIHRVHNNRDCSVFAQELKTAPIVLRTTAAELLERIKKYSTPYDARDDDRHPLCTSCFPYG